jgi:predicted dehydrogenase
MPTAYLSALGVMGRRHLKGLVRAGFSVFACDPNPAAHAAARSELVQSGLPEDCLCFDQTLPASVDVAIFSETTTARFENFRSLLSRARVGRVLLEKPITANPDEHEMYLSLAKANGIAERTQVNFIRRTWPHVQHLADICSREKQFAMTLNGGAIGLGCMGIHYLDTFLCLSGDEMPAVRWANLSAETVKSGRGQQFEDFGGDFVLEGSRGRLFASLSAGSSANVVMTVRGEHFMAQVDYNEMQWKISRRRADSTMPFYRYGADYKIVEQGRLEIPAMDAVTEGWALGRIDLPVLEQALVTHRLLDEILRAGGAHPPYRFT